MLVAATASPVSAQPARVLLDGSAAAPPAGNDAAGVQVSEDLASVHWLHAQEHANDVVAFEPGERVTVPFTPRPGDRWEVDGAAPRALPPGNTTGREMRDSAQGSTWAAGAPGRSGEASGQPDVTGLDGTGLDETVDQPITTVDATVDPASISDSTTDGDATVATAPIGPSGLRREIFGFLPYWEVSDKSTTLDWRTLSTVAYFSVGCTSGGNLAKRNTNGTTTTGWAGWTSSKMTSIINAAHEHQTRVVLTVTCMAWSSSGASTQAALLGSATHRATLAKQIAAAVRDRGADGANLDFEPIVSGYSDEFTALVRRIRTELNNVAPGYQLTFDTMGSIGNQPIADATASGGADAVFIMGYDYRTAGANYAGSISPLTGPIYDLTDTVKAYTARISPSKVILGIPYYGRAWSTASDALHAKTLSQSKYGGSAAPNYAQAVDLATSNGRRWDSVEQSPWTAYRKQTCTSAYGCVTSWRELYYDDSTSLKRRYDLINRENLRGVGIWALGYDNTRTELRAALAEKFLADRTPPVVGIWTLASTQLDEGFRVSWKSWDASPIAGYDVDVSVDGGGWGRWLNDTDLVSRIYLGRDGRLYAFRVRATDIHGNESVWYATSLSALGVPGSITVGGFATVLADTLRMRASPTTGASIMTTLAAGDALRVIGGPTTGEGYTWFQVAGPIRQWRPVDQPQIGGWIAAFGNGVKNAGPRRPVYATRVNAGISGLRLNSGGQRVLTPNGDGNHDRLHLTWTNHVSVDSLALRVYRLDGSFVGSVSLGGTGAGGHSYDWNGRIGGSLVPSGGYVVQLRGLKGSTTYSAPSASPVSATQIARFGVYVGKATPTKVVDFDAPISPNKAHHLTWDLTFGGPIAGLHANDIVRTGTATGCDIAEPTGSGASWTIEVTGCSGGTITIGVRAYAVVDVVRNWGPSSQVNAPKVLIDRQAPMTSKPWLAFRTGVGLTTASTSAGLPVRVSWSATDAGGAGLRDYDVRRSVDAGAWTTVAIDRTATWVTQSLTPGHSYRYEIRARDRAGNVGSWVAGSTIPVVLRQNGFSGITYGGTWKLGTTSGYSGGTVRYSTTAGSSVRYPFTGRAVAFITTKRPDGGKVRVYIDGTYIRTIDLSASTTAFRQVVFAKRWFTTGTHTLRLVVVGGTTGHARVDLDALAVLR
jgi:spore germination protein YaaH